MLVEQQVDTQFVESLDRREIRRSKIAIRSLSPHRFDERQGSIREIESGLRIAQTADGRGLSVNSCRFAGGIFECAPHVRRFHEQSERLRSLTVVKQRPGLDRECVRLAIAIRERLVNLQSASGHLGGLFPPCQPIQGGSESDERQRLATTICCQFPELHGSRERRQSLVGFLQQKRRPTQTKQVARRPAPIGDAAMLQCLTEVRRRGVVVGKIQMRPAKPRLTMTNP